MVGFLPAAYLMGLYLEKTSYTYVQAAVANVIGMFVTLLFGTIWLKIANDLSWTGAMMGGTIPFIIPGLLKAGVATWLGIFVRNRLKQAKLIAATS